MAYLACLADNKLTPHTSRTVLILFYVLEEMLTKMKWDPYQFVNRPSPPRVAEGSECSGDEAAML